MLSAGDFSFLRDACQRASTLPEVSRKRDREIDHAISCHGCAWHCPAETRSLTAGNAVSVVCIVTTYVEFRKRARRDYVYPMIQRYSADRRPSIPRSIRIDIVERERANERAIDSRVLETNKRYANRPLIYFFRPGIRDPRFPQCRD